MDRKMMNPIKKSGMIARMLHCAFPVRVVVRAMAAGPTIAANFPKML